MTDARPRRRSAARPRRAFRAPHVARSHCRRGRSLILSWTGFRLLALDKAISPGATLGRSWSACARSHPVTYSAGLQVTHHDGASAANYSRADRGSLAVLSLHASFSMRPLAYPQARRGKTDRQLGIYVFGPRASELIAEASAAMALSLSSEDIVRTCRVHPVPTGTSRMARSPWPAGRLRPAALRRGPARHSRSEP
jgi:hypothetical protein